MESSPTRPQPADTQSPSALPDGAAPFAFELERTDERARAGRLETPHGPIHTPAFMPVGTHGALKAMTPAQVAETGAEIVLANTYHLALRPGEKLVEKLGGLHVFMQWPGPILTDSGGFQVFSLPGVEIDDRAATFQNEVTGETIDLTPERSIEIQNRLGADIIMAFDECTPWPATREQAGQGVRRTLQWMERCMRAHGRPQDQALFGIVQGSTYPELREACAASLVAMDCPGYAIGGVSVGEGHELLCQVTDHAAPLLPERKPRYLMGVGLPEDLIACIGFGIDMFDCVIPTRYARSATVFTSRGRIRLTNRRFRRDAFPVDAGCDCYTCTGGFTRAYLHHLFAANEVLSAILCSIHNVRFYQRLVSEARRAILGGDYRSFAADFLARYRNEPEAPRTHTLST
ncbi:MAG TPA: tRNA guanosine(34) transglycosylase Tgt [Myxococcota bacterium]|nr:tRNA guanosine(34) transglycosylase Tgt [Myxococcota bacterium]